MLNDTKSALHEVRAAQSEATNHQPQTDNPQPGLKTVLADLCGMGRSEIKLTRRIKAGSAPGVGG